MVESLMALSLVGTGLFAAFLSYYYGNWMKQHKVVTLVHYISWLLPALILVAIPVDIAMAFVDRCLGEESSELCNLSLNKSVNSVFNELPKLRNSSVNCRIPPVHIQSSSLLIFWRIVYWSSQFLTWILIPLMRSYATAGDFTALSRLRTAVIDNALYYTSYLVIFIIALIYLMAHNSISFDLDSLRVLVITSSNTWGLFLVILFLGYGLVAVPRSLWMSGNPLATLRRAYFYLSKRSTELVDEEDKLREVVQHVNQIRSGLPLNHPLRPHLLTVLKRVETIQRSSVLSRRGSPTEYPTNSVDVLGLDLGKLAHLHKSLKTAEQRRNRAEALYREAVNSALWIEDVNTYRTKHRVTAFARDHDSEFLLKVHDYVPAVGSALSSAYWYWCCYVRFWLLRLLSVVLALLSIFMVWSECTFFVRSPTLSTVALLLNAEAERRDYFLVEVCSFFTLGYLGLAVFFTVFRLRIFNYYRLVPSHHTDENSLLFCGSLLCRLTPSLCLNFLGLAHLDSHVTRTTLKSPVTMSGSGVPVPADLATSTVNFHTVPCSAGPLHGVVETTYTRFMGHLDVIPFIARGFNVYFPILVLLLCLLTYFRFGDRVLRRLGILQLMDSMSDLDQDTHPADPLVEDSVQDGKLLLREERMFLSRQNRGHSSESEIGLDLHDVTKTSNDGYYHDDQPPDRAQLLLRCSPFGGEPSSTNVDDSRPRKTHASILPVEYSEEAIENEFPLDTDQHSNLKPLR